MTIKTYSCIVIRSLIVSCIITGALLLLTALLLCLFQPEQSLVCTGMLAIYVLSGFFGGFLTGKGVGCRKFVWGMLTGTLYFLVLLLVSVLCGGLDAGANTMITTLLLCLGGGALGGMFA